MMSDFIIVNKLQELDQESQYLVQKAKEALPFAYAPYSNFHVGACILLEDKKIVTGTNQENASYPAGMCAERVALYSCTSQFPGIPIMKVAVVASSGNNSDILPASPCGQCRQVMLEFEMRQRNYIEVIMQNQQRQWVKALNCRALLPFCFTGDNLKRP